jgi:hypothetical protein
LLSSHGPAHVAGFNAGVSGGVTRCIGCHVGHSTMLERGMGADPSWCNVATSARVTASSVAPGDSARAVVDRRTRGAAADVAWVAGGSGAEWVRLEWPMQLELRWIALYGIARDSRAGTDVNVQAAELRLYHDGREVERREVRGVRSAGTRVEFRRLVVDAVELRITRSRGRVAGVERTGLAEIEAMGRPFEGRGGPTIDR